MKKTILALVLVACTTISFSQTKADFDAAITRFQHFYNSQQTDSIYNMLSDKGKSMMTAEQAAKAFGGIYKQFGNLKSFEITKQKDALTIYKTVFDNQVLSLYISLDKDDKLETFRFIPYKDETTDEAVKKEKSNFIFKAPSGNIYGTLTMPAGDKKVPVVLIIAGSGPTDRDCNNSISGKTNAFVMLADSLQKAGIASVRYDKRGIGESADAQKDEESLRFAYFINDAIGFIQMLKKDPRFSEVYVLGHSEGALIGAIASGEENVAGFISVSGSGENMDELIEKQYSAESKESGEKATVILDSLKAGYTVKEIDPDMYLLFHPSIQPYLRSLLKYDPREEIKKLTIPVLIVQGTTDLQVSVADANNLKKACHHAKLELVDGMNHVLKQAPADRGQNFATYDKPDLPLSPGLMPGIVAFVYHSK